MNAIERAQIARLAVTIDKIVNPIKYIAGKRKAKPAADKKGNKNES